jgi:ribosomal protein S18 acetylase RimI-like enzyme
MEFSIRRAVIADAEEIARVHVEGWKNTYAGIVPDAYLASLDVKAHAELWKENIAAGEAIILVSESGCGIFGFAAGGKLREPIEGFDGELGAIYLLRGYQRCGAGRRLVEAVASQLRAQGMRSMAVRVLAQNPAVEFYRKLGGQVIEESLFEIGGASLPDLVMGWPDISVIFDPVPQSVATAQH